MPTTAQSLINAVRTRNYESLRELISRGADIAARSPAGRTALHAAAEEGDQQAARILLQAGADVNARMVNGLTPLHLAASYGGFGDLMDLDEDRREPDNLSETLHLSIELAWVILKIAEEKYPEIWSELEPEDKVPDGKGAGKFVTAIEIFANPAELYQEIKSRGVDIDRLDPNLTDRLQGRPRFLGLVQLLIDHHADVRAVDVRGTSALSDAVELGTAQMVALLLRHGADPNPKPIDDFPLQSLVAKAMERSKVDVAGELIKGGAAFDPNGDGALHSAASNGRLKVVTWLLDQGADINLRDDEGDTPLLSAGGHSEVVAALIARGADMRVQNNQGDGVLHLCAPWPDCRERILSQGLPIDSPNGRGRTVMHVVASSGDGDDIRAMRAVGASVNLQDHEGNTPLHCAFSSDEYRPDVEFPSFHALLVAGADCSIKNAAGKTAYDLAVEAEYPEEYLRLLDPVGVDPKMFIWLGQPPYDQFLPRAMVAFELEGLTWPSAEHYFHAQKSSDPKVRAEISRASARDVLACLHDYGIKRSPSWSQKCDEIMHLALLEKFRQNPELHRELLATGAATLISDGHCDDYWMEKRGAGFNAIGKMLMDIRRQLGT